MPDPFDQDLLLVFETDGPVEEAAGGFGDISYKLVVHGASYVYCLLILLYRVKY